MKTTDDAENKRLNRLAREKSPYLLQHAENPVDWFPWGEEAFSIARQQDKPVFLSIGYATCHWCHVMAHESFEDEAVAEILNQNYIPIKVDREERPDIDKVYMSACQAMTRGGGWPLSIFMTPEGKPFFAGTYFPKESRMGITGFTDLLQRIAQLWDQDRQQLSDAADEITTLLQPGTHSPATATVLGESTLEKGYSQLLASFDHTWGGFSQSPKFPMPHNLTFLLRWHHRNGDDTAAAMVKKTLSAMRNGGIFDHIGFGFHRYSVDEKWLVPHFEKMLYDQALLSMAYTEAAQSFGSHRFEQVAREIFTYVLRDMSAPEGGFYSAQDADSEGSEGLFYVWTPEEVKMHLGEETGDLYCRFFNILPGGNFEDGLSIPHVTESLPDFAGKVNMDMTRLGAILDNSRQVLFDIREKRVPPLKDDKILTSWNGLMIAALAKGYQAFGDPVFLNAAQKSVDFILEKLVKDQKFLLRRYREGEAAYPGYLDDYAFFIWGLIELYESSFATRHLEAAITLQTSMLDLFWDETGGGFFFAGKRNESLVVRSKDAYDGALPSGNSLAVLNLLRLGRMIGRTDWELKADRVVHAFAPMIANHPIAFTQFLAAVDFITGPSREIVISGDPAWDSTQQMARMVQTIYLPNKVVVNHPGGEEGRMMSSLAPYLASMGTSDGRAAAYVCKQYSCQRPVTDPESLRRLLSEA